MEMMQYELNFFDDRYKIILQKTQGTKCKQSVRYTINGSYVNETSVKAHKYFVLITQIQELNSKPVGYKSGLIPIQIITSSILTSSALDSAYLLVIQIDPPEGHMMFI